MTITPIVIGTLGTVTEGLVKGLEDLEIKGRVEKIQTTALVKSARILRRVLSLRLQWNIIRESCCEKLPRTNNNNNTNA